MRRRKAVSSCIGLAIGISLFATSHALAATIAYGFDFGSSSFSYTVAPGTGGKVGTLTISDDAVCGSVVALAKLDMSTNSELDWAKNMDADTYDFRVQADVIKLASNSYRLVGTLKVTDTSSGSSLASPKVLANFVSNAVNVQSGNFFYEGSLSVSGSNDALLLPSSLSSWVYEGVPGDTPVSPNGDGVLGRVTELTGRSDYTWGHSAGGVQDPNATSADAFFASNQGSTSFNVQAYILPEPATILLGLAALGGMIRRRR